MSSPENQITSDFIRLITDHQNALRGLIVAMLPGSQDINDILQDTNVILWEKRQSYKAGSDFKAWAYAIARIKVMQHWDQRKRLGKILLNEEIVNAAAEMRSTEPSGADEIKLNALRKCLSALTAQEQDLINARYTSHGGLTNYAERTQKSAESLRAILYRTRKKLRKCIDKRLDMRGGLA
ncbi:RNA polymerase sigma-70 factor, ECF subfamily [Rubritalea squalenifaciens DSM 18772]|uniref:RNA polymerase sigma-70 factor, ECF subfamily n=2 Tax=Rubritalea TaxID=361050 RepID=A0A1M6JAF8_9BACT|nr:sigma-70 family RNA polymerase sigma factor [Rubritalea squalenifaciens]SHJ43620.1 RNA polymerase sigma-70 factor, ECF subfamily [Rubritalea squalenifaciens DSM 18772]